jgi:hypothetical protein
MSKQWDSSLALARCQSLVDVLTKMDGIVDVFTTDGAAVRDVHTVVEKIMKFFHYSSLSLSI